MPHTPVVILNARGAATRASSSNESCLRGRAQVAAKHVRKASEALVVHEGHLQEPLQCLPFLRVEAIESVTQTLKIYFRGVSAKYSIPKRKDIGVIRVGLFLISRMMHLVHMWCDDYQSQQSIHFGVHPDIGVFQLRVQSGENQIDEYNPQRNTENENCGKLPKCSPNRFARMLPKSSSHINSVL